MDSKLFQDVVDGFVKIFPFKLGVPKRINETGTATTLLWLTQADKSGAIDKKLLSSGFKRMKIPGHYGLMMWEFSPPQSIGIGITVYYLVYSGILAVDVG